MSQLPDRVGAWSIEMLRDEFFANGLNSTLAKKHKTKWAMGHVTIPPLQDSSNDTTGEAPTYVTHGAVQSSSSPSDQRSASTGLEYSSPTWCSAPNLGFLDPYPHRRQPFQDPSLRLETANTRKIGSCIRCRMQRTRVSIFTLLAPERREDQGH
jgi:hypothetical protein